MKSLLSVTLLLVAASCSDAASTVRPAPDGPSIPPSLVHAHDAYLRGNLIAMSGSLKDVLSLGALDADVRDNALRLLEVAYERGEGAVPASWELPRGLTRLELGEVLVEEGGHPRMGTWLSGYIDDPHRMRGLVLSRAGEVLLDKAGGIGLLDKMEPEEDGTYYFSLEREGMPPLEPGIYDVRIELENAEPVLGWVIVSTLTPTAVPHIRLPLADATIDGNPTLAIDEFFSPSYRPFEQRTLWVGVSQGQGTFPWQLWTAHPSSTAIILGKEPAGKPETTFARGRYTVVVQCSEKRRFGPMLLSRSGRSHQRFWVR